MSIPSALVSLASKNPELLRAFGEAAASALRSRNPWRAALLSLLRRSAPHLASGLANELTKVLSK